MKTMKHTKAQALLSLLLAAALALGTLFSAAPAAFAASVDTRYPTKSMTGYILSTGNRTAVAYSSIGGSSVGYIYANDNCTIQAYYYTGETKKLSGCGTCYPSVSVTGYVNTSSLPLVLRKTASSGSASLARMPRGSALTVLDNKAATNGFYHVKYGSLTGYASAGYITFTKPSQTSALLWPAAAKQVTCMYYYKTGAKHSTRYGYRNALDIAGGGNIYAAAAGKVETATYQSGGFGRYVVILHNDGTRTLYGHLNSLSVKAGDYVSQGQTIGVMGSTGNSSGTHLHFEWSGGDPWNTYFKSNTGLIYEANVRANNAKFNADKTIVNYLDTYYRYSNGWYYRK